MILFEGLTAGVQAQPAGSILSGVVRNAWSHEPLRKAVVTLSTTGSDPLDAVAYSDSNGAFAFAGVPPGEYLLCARVRLYEHACYGGTAERGRPLPHLIVQAHRNQQDIVLAALPLGSITGTVRDSDGDPLPNAQVQMLRAVYERRILHWRSIEQAATDNRGEFRIAFVRPGRYRFRAERQFLTAVRVQPDVSYGQKPIEELYKPQYYPNSDSVDSAESLTLNAGNEIKGIDFTLAPVERALVSGRLVPPTGVDFKGDGAENFAPLMLFLIPANGSNTGEANSAGAAPPDFTFQFNSVLPGSYRLISVLRANNHVYFGTEAVEAGAGSGNLNIALVPGSPLSGHLKLEGKGAQEHGPYQIRLVPADYGSFLGEQPSAEVKPDGSFRFDEIVPGIWDIGVEPLPPGSYIRSMMLGQKDVLTDDMTLKPGAREPLEMVLSMDGAIINGEVLENGKAAGRSMVLLAPFGSFDNVLSFYQSVMSDENGRFEFKSVTPGRYKIHAFDRMEPGEYEDPNFLKPYAAVGEAFDVPDGARMNRTTTLIIRGESGSQ